MKEFFKDLRVIIFITILLLFINLLIIEYLDKQQDSKKDLTNPKTIYVIHIDPKVAERIFCYNYDPHLGISYSKDQISFEEGNLVIIDPASCDGKKFNSNLERVIISPPYYVREFSPMGFGK